MEQKQTQIPANADHTFPVTTVAMLRCAAPDHIDGEPVAHIVASKGQPEAEEMICRVLEDIAYRLDALQVAKNAHAFDSVAKPARRIVHVAAQIGLLDVSKSAVGVADASQGRDGVALSATLARLERAFDLAVTEIWQFRDNMH